MYPVHGVCYHVKVPAGIAPVMTTELPPIGLGTSGMDDPDDCRENVRMAIEAGYEHIDTAQMYGNEASVGRGIEAADVEREDVFLATKVHPENLAYDDVIESTRASLDALGVESVDLLYVHWPTDAYDPEATLPAFDEVRDRGWTDHVGVSNFDLDLLADARERLDAPVVANQVEMHPLLPPTGAMLSYCTNHDVAPVAYSPLCRGEALGLDGVIAVAEKHDASPARVLISWLAHQSVPVVTKASGTDHIEDNLAGLGLGLDNEDRMRIDGIERRYRRFDRDGSPWT